MRIRSALTLSVLLAASAQALAQTPAAAAPASAPAVVSPAPARAAAVGRVVQLGVDVPPYYLAGRRLGAPPAVAVDPAYDKLLASARRKDIQQAETAIGASPDLVKPETMIVLAMRLYDVGLRDDAVFWFYVASGRYATMQQVLDLRSLQLVRSADVVETFIRVAGPAMEGYAYCSIARQAELEDRAISWVAAHPYKILGYSDLPATSEDRNAALAAAVDQLRDASRRNKAMLADPTSLAEFEQTRAENHAHEHYCW